MAEVFSGTVAVIGLGYIGLPTAAVLATRGVAVVGVDVNAATVESVSRGDTPFVEPELAAVVARAVSTGFLTATTGPRPPTRTSSPSRPRSSSDHSADLTYVFAAVDALAPGLSGGEVVILESTSPPGTTRLVSAEPAPAAARPADAARAPRLPTCSSRTAPSGSCPARSCTRWSRTTGSSAGSPPPAPSRPQRSTGSSARARSSSPTPRAPRWPSSSRTPTAT